MNGARQTLPEESQRHVCQAQEFLDRGLPARADEELERVDQKFRAHPDLLEARIAFHVYLRKFEEAVPLARLLEKIYPERKGVIPRLMRRFGLDGLVQQKE